MYQMIALDLDGTVLTDRHTIQPDVKKIIHSLKDHYHIMIVTGRHHTAAMPYYHELGLSTPIICCNGTYLYDYAQNKVIDCQSIKKSHAFTFLDFIQAHGLNCVMYVSDAMLYDKQHPIDYILTLSQWADSFPKENRPNIKGVDCFHQAIEENEYIWKFVVDGSPEQLHRIMSESWIKNNFTAEKSWENRVDFSAKGNTKGARLAKYLKHIKISPTQTIAFGDNHNDISMLSLVGQGIAMNHADPIVKQHATSICPTDNNGSGISKQLIQILNLPVKENIMTKPMIQIALDQTDLVSAVEVAKNVESYVDVIEVGTILAFAEGMNAVSTLRKNHPNHILVCDMKTTDGGAILAKMAFEAGANWITVSAAAHIATIEACKKVADEFNGEIQIEIYGNWTFEDAQSWVDLGIKQAIYHRSRDAELAGIGWTEEDIAKMQKLSDLGIELSITGGIVPEDLYLFEGIKAKTFIAGRALAGEKGKDTAADLRTQIDRFWN